MCSYSSCLCATLSLYYIGATVLLETDAGTGTILMDNVHCSGSELRLIDCEHHDAPNCYHYEDVGVNCIIPGQNVNVSVRPGHNDTYSGIVASVS